MKKFALFFFALAMMSSSIVASAQTASPECNKWMDFYQQNYKQKQYDDALPQWRNAYKLCPKNYKANLYIQGAFLLNRELNKAKNRNLSYREALIDSLLTLQDERLQYFPTGKKNGEVQDFTASILNNKGQYIINFRGSNNKYLYEELGKIAHQLGSETKGGILVNYLQSAIALYKSKDIKVDDVMSVYTFCADCLAEANPADDAEATAIGEAKTTLESIFAESNVASCENLIAIFTPRFNADPDNVAQVSNIAKLLGNANCIDSDLYLRAATKLHSLDPSASSAYLLYRLNAKKNNTDEAIKYIEEAISLCGGNEALAQYNYELASFAYGKGLKLKAYNAAKVAAELNCGYAGKAYLIMGNIWAGNSCGGNEVTRYGHNWAACDFYIKAKAADPSVAAAADRGIASNSYAPPAYDAFMYGYQNGQAITVSCGGITTVTTIRLSN